MRPAQFGPNGNLAGAAGAGPAERFSAHCLSRSRGPAVQPACPRAQPPASSVASAERCREAFDFVHNVRWAGAEAALPSFGEGRCCPPPTSRCAGTTTGRERRGHARGQGRQGAWTCWQSCGGGGGARLRSCLHARVGAWMLAWMPAAPSVHTDAYRCIPVAASMYNAALGGAASRWRPALEGQPNRHRDPCVGSMAA